MNSAPHANHVRALADPLRLRIVSLLADEALCTCHIVSATGSRQTNVSNHLRILREAGLIIAEPHGRYTYYRLNDDAMRELAARFSFLADAAETVKTHHVRRPCP